MSRYKKYMRSPKGIIARRYADMKQRINKNKYYEGLELMSRADFEGAALGDPDFWTTWEAWVASDYDSKLAPSVDRIDSKKGYTMDNITWCSRSENTKRRWSLA